MTTMIPFHRMSPEQRRSAEKELMLPEGYLDQPRFKGPVKKYDQVFEKYDESQPRWPKGNPQGGQWKPILYGAGFVPAPPPPPPDPSDPETWHDPEADAVFVDGSPVPDELNGVKVKPWSGVKDWTKVDGQWPELERNIPDLSKVKHKKVGAGVVIREQDGRYWVVEPAGHFGGYKNTFPKGTKEKGLTLQQTAIKEAWEESGLKVKITGYVGDFERTTSVARYYHAVRVGGSPSAFTDETQAVKLLSPQRAIKALNNKVDQKILYRAVTGT